MNLLRWLRWPLALAALILTCAPSAIWHPPATDVVLAGFDPNLEYASPSAHVSRQMVTLIQSDDQSAAGAGQASINLLSTPLKAFAVSMRVVVQSDGSVGVPLRIGVWSTFTGAGYFVEFIASSSSIRTQALIRGGAGPTLAGGEVTRARALGSYAAGQSYVVSFAVDKAKAITVRVIGDNLHATDSLTAPDAPELFHSTRFNLTASAVTSSGTSRSALADYVLTLPHQTYWANKVDDNRERIVFIAILVLGMLVVGAAGTQELLQLIRSRPSASRECRRAFSKYVLSRKRFIAVASVATILYLVGNLLLFPLGSHPFDMGNEKLYAYVARTYGAVDLYYVPTVVSLAGLSRGVPYIENAFPYEPAMAYLFTAIGWAHSILFSGGDAFRLNSSTLEYVIKATNVAFGLADAALIYLILQRLGLNERWRVGAAGLFLFNPAVWFSMSVWGQTHVISIFFVLAAVLLAEMGYSLGAWLALAIACLTRPQMLVIGLFVGIVFLRRFSWKQNVSNLSWTVMLTFLALSPFTFLTSPSLPIDIMINVFRIQEAGGNEVALTTVSQDAYSIWPLVTYITHGASGLERAFTPSSATLIGALTYQGLSQILTLAAILIVSGVLLWRKRSIIDSGAYLPLVALGITLFLMLSTGLVATHFLLALPFLVLCRRWMSGVAYFYVVIIWTATTLVPMFGDLGVAISGEQHSLLAPANNPVTRLFVQLYSWDRFITVGIVANICAVLWLGILSVRPAAPHLTPLASS